MAPVRIYCRPHGPYVIEGEILIVDQQGREFVPPASNKNNVALCRCGKSQKRPFCDGSHHAVGFQADDQAPSA